MTKYQAKCHFKFDLQWDRCFTMYCCVKCNKTFRTRTEFKSHNERKIPCRPATHFCSMCRKGLASRRSLRLHKKRCRNSEGSSEIEAKIQGLRKIVNEFFEHLSGDFTHKLHELEKIFIQDSNTNEPENTYTTLLQSTAFGSVISK